MLDDSNIRDAVCMARELREKLLRDRYRPGFHFCVPEDVGIPGDPNGAFYANGRYHLMYLYDCREDSFRWGHVSSTDLLHWRWHPDALLPDATSKGIFSGGAFADDDGRVYLTYWGLPRPGNEGGIRIAFSDDSDGHYSDWKQWDGYVIASDEWGITHLKDAGGDTVELVGSADPSNIWKDGGRYYMQTGNLLLLEKHRRRENGKIVINPGTPDKYKGDSVGLFRSYNLVDWEYVHRFYDRFDGDDAPDDTEDDMCPSFLPLPASCDGGEPSGKYLQLFIAHNRGAQYYIGEYDRANQRFIPEIHGRFSREDNSNFAPEALIAPDGRQISWQWILENHSPGSVLANGWDGVYTLPRTLWFDGEALGIAPIKELESLRYNERDNIDGIIPPMSEISAVFGSDLRERAGVTVCIGEGGEYADVYYDPEKGELCIQTNIRRDGGMSASESLPLVLRPGEKLRLDIFLDNGIIEAFANGRQAVMRRVYPSDTRRMRARVIGEGKPEIKLWELMPTNMY